MPIWKSVAGAVYVNRSNHDLKDLKRVPKKSFLVGSKKWLKDNGDGEI